MLLVELFFTFFKIGLFAVGGGLATLPFIYELADANKWITTQDVLNIVAISESTPGPLGVNIATYVGFLMSELTGAVVATLGLIVPSIIIIIIIANFLDKFKDNKTVKNIFYGLRAASCALIAAAGLEVAKFTFFRGDISITNMFLPGIILAIVLLIATKKLKWHPVIFIAISAIIGIVFKFG